MNSFDPGDYEIHFTAQLPSHIPSSFYFKEEEKKNKWAPNMKVGYYALATLKCANAEYNLSHKKVLIIREKPETLETFKNFSK